MGVPGKLQVLMEGVDCKGICSAVLIGQVFYIIVHGTPFQRSELRATIRHLYAVAAKPLPTLGNKRLVPPCDVPRRIGGHFPASF